MLQGKLYHLPYLLYFFVQASKVLVSDFGYLVLLHRLRRLRQKLYVGSPCHPDYPLRLGVHYDEFFFTERREEHLAKVDPEELFKKRGLVPPVLDYRIWNYNVARHEGPHEKVLLYDIVSDVYYQALPRRRQGYGLGLL